jgi:hypothetical protein
MPLRTTGSFRRPGLPRPGLSRQHSCRDHVSSLRAAAIAVACAVPLTAQAAPNTGTTPDAISQRVSQLEQELRDLKSRQPVGAADAQGQQPGGQAPGAQGQQPEGKKPAGQGKGDETQQRLDEQEKRIDELAGKLDELKPGNEKFTLNGFVWAGFTMPQHGTSTFDSAFKPVFLWKATDDLLVAASAEFEIADNATEVNIEYANINWMANDWLMLRGGVILSPISNFQHNLHPQWINKLPDNPLFAADNGLAPEKAMGVEARGGLRSGGSSRFTYSLFVTNGPSMNNDLTSPNYGQLVLDEFTDSNNNKAVGGRLGFQPVPELEVAYAAEFCDVQPPGSVPEHLNLGLHDVSVSYVDEPGFLGGRIDARVEFIFADFSKDIPSAGGGGNFNNDRWGGYAQLAYRPTKAEGALKDLEGVVRWDRLDQPSGAPLPADEYRVTVGLNYWSTARCVLKAAFQFDTVHDPSNALGSNNAFLLQAAIGF